MSLKYEPSSWHRYVEMVVRLPLALADFDDAMQVRLGEREFFIDNLPVRIHFIIAMIKRTGLAPWESFTPCGVECSQYTRMSRPSVEWISRMPPPV